MIITNTQKIDVRNVADYSWRRLSQFNNADYTAQVISKLHKLDAKNLSNARKQAEQIKYCLTQGREYYQSAVNVSLATRPVLLYYCAMSLALAEVLLKQTGESRLSELRSKHNCHGLSLAVASSPLPTEPIEQALKKLVAKVQTGADGLAKGTYEVWRRSAREYPVGGVENFSFTGHTLSTFKSLFHPVDEPPPQTSTAGISLFSCITNLPYMQDALHRWGSGLKMIRARVSQETNESGDVRLLKLVIQPGPQANIDSFSELCVCSPAMINELDITEFQSGFALTWNTNNSSSLTLPHATIDPAL